MKDYAMAPRYAKVLFDLDCIKSCVEERLEDFTSILNIFNDNPKFIRFLKAPQVSQKDKKKVLHDSLIEAFDPAFINFLSYLMQKGRLADLGCIESAYRRLVNDHLERWEADLVTAVPIDSEIEAKLVKKLEKNFHKKINLNKKVDPNIIGGAILVVSNEMLDWSVASRLRKLKKNLNATQV